MKGEVYLILVKKIVLFFVAAVFLMPNFVQANDIDDYPTMAVLPFQNKAAVTWNHFGNYAGTAGEDAGFELQRSGRFEVIEREQLQAIVDEHSLNMTGLVNPASAVEIGKMSGADFVAIGSVTSLTAKSSAGVANSGGMGGTMAGGQIYTVSAKVMLRVVDVKTGRVVLYGRGKGHSDSSNWTVKTSRGSGYTVTIGTVEVSQEQCTNAIEKAVKDSINGKDGILAELDGRVK